MSTLTISLLQTPITWMDGEANLDYFAQQIRQTADSDLLVLPEMFTTGFSMQAATHSLNEECVIDWLQAQAKLNNTAICGSAAIKLSEGAVNRFYFMTPEGEYYHYDKYHLFRMAGEHHHYQPGKRRVIIEYRGWKILPQICYDLRFPVFSRNTDQDYDLIIYVASWPAARAKHWQALLVARAIENQSWVVGCNRVGNDGNGFTYSGDSQIIAPEGDIVAIASPGETTRLTATIDRQRVVDYRQAFPAWQDADRFSLTPPIS